MEQSTSYIKLKQIFKEEIRKVLSETQDKSTKNDEYSIYNPNNTSSESIFVNYKGPKNKKNKQGMAEGFWVDKGDRIISLSMYKNGKEDGPKEIYSDGKIYTRGMMKDDKQVGVWQEFINGKFDEFTEWENGKPKKL